MSFFDLTAARQEIQGRLAPEEDIDEVMGLAVHLANRRAQLLGRKPEQGDLEFVLAAFCWWPGKTEPPSVVRTGLVRVRSQLLRYRRMGFRQTEGRSEVGNRLAEVVFPTSSLTMTFDDLERAEQRSINYLNTDALDDTALDDTNASNEDR